MAVDRGYAFELDDPPLRIEELAGAQAIASTGGARMRLSGSGQVIAHLGRGKDWPRMAGRVGGDAELRADCDTFVLALDEPDEPTRLVTLFRLYDRLADAAMETESALLTERQVDAVVAEALHAIADQLTTSQRDRLSQTLRHACSRVRSRSRAEIIQEHLAAQGQTVDLGVIRRVDGIRGRFAHRSSTAGSSVDPDVLSTVQTIVRAELARRLELGTD